MASDFQRQGAQILKKYAYFLFRLQLACPGFGRGGVSFIQHLLDKLRICATRLITEGSPMPGIFYIKRK
jgi:hypothetical protein